MMSWTCGVVSTLVLGLSFSTVLAQVPSQLNYQGRVSVDGTNFNGTAQFQFSLVDGGSNLSHQATATATVSGGFMTIVTVDEGGDGYVAVPAVSLSGGGGSGAAATAQLGAGVVTNIVVDNPGSGYTTAPDVALDEPPADLVYEVYWTNGAPMDVSVTKGLYSVALGDTEFTNMDALPSDIFTNSDVRLRVTFDDGVVGPEQLTPDSRIVSAGYAMMAAAIQDGAVTAAKLADDAVEEAKLADDAVTGAKIADTAVDTAQLVGDAVTSDKIADGTIGAADLDTASFSNTFWKTDGNAGTLPVNHFLGTTDNRALEIRVNNQRAFRIDPATTPRWAAGYTGNIASVVGSVVVGGGNSAAGPNVVRGSYSTIAGGVDNTVALVAEYSFIGSGYGNIIQTNADQCMIGAGSGNTIEDGVSDAMIGGGAQNKINSSASYSFIGGGYGNTIWTNAQFDVIGGGYQNIINYYAYYGSIAGGFQNTLETDVDYGSIGGGYQNTIQSNADYSVISGGDGNTIQTNSGAAVISGGEGNLIQTNADYCVISGGFGNEIHPNTDYSIISGGDGNLIESGADHGFIGGGEDNTIHTNTDNNVIGGGSLNESSGTQNTIAGGRVNRIQGWANYNTIAGGVGNKIEGNCNDGAIGGGYYNTIESNVWYGTIPGGRNNTISNDCDYAFSAGRQAKAGHKGAFVWADFQVGDFGSTTSNQVSFRCQEGVRFNSGIAGANQEVSWVPGDASWTFTSDQEKKENFAPVDTAAVLKKVADLPIQWWVYKGYDVRHIGPMAQDFHAAFDVGRDKKGLDGADLDGVAFAAIQGLIQENCELKARLAEEERKGEALDARLSDLERKVRMWMGDPPAE